MITRAEDSNIISLLLWSIVILRKIFLCVLVVYELESIIKCYFCLITDMEEKEAIDFAVMFLGLFVYTTNFSMKCHKFFVKFFICNM